MIEGKIPGNLSRIEDVLIGSERHKFVTVARDWLKGSGLDMFHTLGTTDDAILYISKRCKDQISYVVNVVDK